MFIFFLPQICLRLGKPSGLGKHSENTVFECSWNLCVPITSVSVDVVILPEHKKPMCGLLLLLKMALHHLFYPVVSGEDSAEPNHLLVLICLETGAHWGWGKPNPFIYLAELPWHLKFTPICCQIFYQKEND